MIPVNPTDYYDIRDGRFYAHYVLGGRQYEADLTSVLHVGQTDRAVDADPKQIIQALSDVGPWRYTFFMAWAECKRRLEDVEIGYKVWFARRYQEAVAACQREKAAGVSDGSRSRAEQIAQAVIEARIICDNEDEWRRQQDVLVLAKDMERRAEGLFLAIDKRSKELATVVTNLGFLLRNPV